MKWSSQESVRELSIMMRSSDIKSNISKKIRKILKIHDWKSSLKSNKLKKNFINWTFTNLNFTKKSKIKKKNGSKKSKKIKWEREFVVKKSKNTKTLSDKTSCQQFSKPKNHNHPKNLNTTYLKFTGWETSTWSKEADSSTETNHWTYLKRSSNKNPKSCKRKRTKITCTKIELKLHLRRNQNQRHKNKRLWWKDSSNR